MPKLRGRIAVVAGASRGAGRGIALALGDAGATVYVAGRSTRGGWTPNDRAPGTIEDTAEEVSARGGVGIPVRVDFTNDAEVAGLFERVEREQGKLDVLANAVWGAADGYTTMDEFQQAWGQPFFQQSPAAWQHMMNAGPYAYYLASLHAARIMAKQKKGLIVSVTDGMLDGAPDEVMNGTALGEYGGQLIWDLAHICINRLMTSIARDVKPFKIAVVTLMPGFMRTERVVRFLDTEALRKSFGFDKSETTEYVGRAVAALAADPKAITKSGRIHFVADLAREYGFTDADGKQIPRFNPFAAATT